MGRGTREVWSGGGDALERERERETRLWGDGEEGLGGGMKHEGEVLSCDEVIIVWFWILQVKMSSARGEDFCFSLNFGPRYFPLVLKWLQFVLSELSEGIHLK
jgi:hypothetical protein